MADDTGSLGPQTTLGVLFSRLSTQVSTLIRGEVALAKAQAKQMGSRFGAGAGALAVAGALALFGLGWLFSAMFYGWLALTGRDWAAALLTALVIFVLVGICALVGIYLIKQGQKSMPHPQDGLKAGAQTVKTALKAAVQSDPQVTKDTE